MSDTNVDQDTTLCQIDCSNQKNTYCSLLCEISDVGITVQNHHHCNHSSAGLRWLCYCDCCSRIGDADGQSIGVSSLATVTRVEIMVGAATAGLELATGVLIILATAAFGISRMLAGTTARTGSDCQSRILINRLGSSVKMIQQVTVENILQICPKQVHCHS